MEKQLKDIFKKLDQWIEQTNRAKYEEGFAFKPDCKITILGQIGLLIDKEIALKLNPLATVDLDVWIKADGQIRTKLEELLKMKGLILDPLSEHIWLPDRYEAEVFYQGQHVTCHKVKPLYLLVSKAIKAKEKNRPLIAEAIALYRDELVDLIEEYGGDPNYFFEE